MKVTVSNEFGMRHVVSAEPAGGYQVKLTISKDGRTASIKESRDGFQISIWERGKGTRTESLGPDVSEKGAIRRARRFVSSGRIPHVFFARDAERLERVRRRCLKTRVLAVSEGRRTYRLGRQIKAVADKLRRVRATRRVAMPAIAFTRREPAPVA